MLSSFSFRLFRTPKIQKKIENSWFYIKSTIINRIKRHSYGFSIYFCRKHVSMRRYSCLFLIVFLSSGMAIYSQEWTAEDSLWMQRVQNGTEKIRLNEATRKAIESGTLIRDPSVLQQFKSNPLEMPIVKSFEGITAPKNQLRPQDLPVSVYKIYIQNLNLNLKDSIPAIRPEALGFNAKTIAELKTLDANTPRKATVDDPFTIRPGATGSFSAEDILRTILSPSHRAKKRNAKNANAWKTYTEY